MNSELILMNFRVERLYEPKEFSKLLYIAVIRYFYRLIPWFLLLFSDFPDCAFRRTTASGQRQQHRKRRLLAE